MGFTLRRMDATHTILASAIDYAGLFPPAQLGMVDAARNYAEYRQGEDAWALGRFVVPANRLDVLARTVESMPGEPTGEPWPLSVLAGPRLADDLERIGTLARERFRAEALEIRASTVDEILGIGALAGGEYETYVELPLGDEVSALIESLASQQLRAKIRTGGITADAFPAAEAIVRFISACLASGVPFKATAGLHHPLRGAYRLTYEINSATAEMFGYLNVLAATAVLRSGGGEAEALHVMMESDPDFLRVEGSALVWRDRHIDAGTLASVRREAMISFGSCSFREPLDELAEVRA
jgi:hypothetical protein